MRSVCCLLLLLPALGCDGDLWSAGGRVGDTHSLRAMTWNVFDGDRWSASDGGPRDAVLDLIEAERPDLLGVQEALIPQVLELAEGLPGYDWVGVGLEDGVEAGELGPIFYRRDRYELVGDGTFWLSNTPDVPGSSFEDADVRIATWVELIDRVSGRPFLALNSHWDDASEDARAFGASLIVQQLSFLAPNPMPRVVLGDFNCTEDSEPMGTLRNGGRLDDAYRVAHPNVEPNEATDHGGHGDPAGERIDHLLVSTGLFDVDRAEIVRRTSGGSWPANHFPVVADLQW